MLDLSPAKLLIVFIVAVVLVGPNKLPSVARQLGAAWRQLRQFHEKMESDIRQNMPDLPSSSDIAKLARSPVAFLNQMAQMPPGDEDRLVADPGAEAHHGNGNGDRTALTNGPTWPADPVATENHAPGVAAQETGWAAEAAEAHTAPVAPDDPSMN
jgi:sec-independent protein translocase protein TatB